MDDTDQRLLRPGQKNAPTIEIICSSAELDPIARAVGYGIEEEGLPYLITIRETGPAELYELAHKGGLGVVIGVDRRGIAVYTRQFKEKKPLFQTTKTELETAKTIGKNAARIIKNKPFIE